MSRHLEVRPSVVDQAVGVVMVGCLLLGAVPAAEHQWRRWKAHRAQQQERQQHRDARWLAQDQARFDRERQAMMNEVRRIQREGKP